MEAFRQALAHTPLWVWPLLIFLIVIGARAMRPSVTSFPRLAILPAVFFIWGLTSLLTTFSPTPVSIGAWASGLAIGIAIGRLLVARIALRADKTQGLLFLPGTSLSLVLILLIFVTKYAFAFAMARRRDLITDPAFVSASLGFSGLLTGMLVGRFLGLWLKYRGVPHEPLSTT